jgi:hypothetical protein
MVTKTARTITTVRATEDDVMTLRRLQLARFERGGPKQSLAQLVHDAIALLVKAEREAAANR